MGLSLEEPVILLVILVAYAFPVAAVLWMAAQYLQTRQLGERVRRLEGDVERMTGELRAAAGAEGDEGTDGPAG